MSNNTERVQKGKNEGFTIIVEGINGYYPDFNNALIFDTTESTVSSEPVLAKSFESTDYGFTYHTTPTTLLSDGDDMLERTQTFKKLTFTGTTPNIEPISTNNQINFNTNMHKGACAVKYCSKDTVYVNTTQLDRLTYKKASSTDAITPGQYKCAYMGDGDDIWKTYEYVWGVGSMPSGYTFGGWSVYNGQTGDADLVNIYNEGDKIIAGNDTMQTQPRKIDFYLIPIFEQVPSENHYIIEVTYNDDAANVSIE